MATFLDKLIEVRDRFLKPIGVFNAGDPNSDDKLPVAASWFFASPYGQPRGINVHEVRQFASSPWVQMVESSIDARFMTTPYSFVNTDDEDLNTYPELEKKAKDFFQRVNSNGHNLLEELVPVLIDVAEIDAGALIKRYSVDSYEDRDVEIVDELGKPTGQTQRLPVLKPFGQRTLNELWYTDGSTLLKHMDAHRREYGYFQYSWKYPQHNPVFFFKDEVSYWAMRQKSYNAYGFSPLQTVLQVVEVLIQSTRWNKDFFKNNAMPNGIISIDGISDKDVEKIQKTWQREFKGKPHKLFLTNGRANFNPLLMNAREMEWLEGQEWYMHLVFGVYRMSPIEVGYYNKVNVGNQEGQERVHGRNGIEPYFKYAENRINTDILPEILQIERPPIKIVWDFEDTEKQTRQHDQSMDKLDRHVYTINEVRSQEGKEPVAWGDEPVQMQQQQSELDAQQPPRKLQRTAATVAATVEASESYGDFFEQQVQRWEQRTIKALEKAELDESVTKTFGEFLQDMTTTINSSPFFHRVRRFIKDSMMDGLAQAEDELEVQVGTGKVFNERVKALEHQQLNGYTINGEPWYGIRGVTADLRLKILAIIEEGVKAKRTRDEITRDVRNVFQGTTINQAKRITRTETTRFINEGKLSAYKDSGAEGRKKWDVVPVGCCDECEDMSKRYQDGVAFDEPFVTKDGRHVQYPPLHPHCRCVIAYVKA